MTAMIILIAPGGNAVENGILTAFFILLADGFILAGFLSRHDWLKLSIWAASIYSLTVGTIYIWTPRVLTTIESDGYGGNYEIAIDTPTKELFANLTFGGYILTFGLLAAILFSMFWKVIDRNYRPMILSYYGAMAMWLIGITSFVVFTSINDDEFDLLLRIGFASLFLSFTSAAIMFISLIINFGNRAKDTRQLPTNVGPGYGAYGPPVQSVTPSVSGDNTAEIPAEGTPKNVE